MRSIIPIALIILLSSCDTTTNYYSETVQSWQGAPIKELTSRWGTPDNLVNGPGGKTIYVYKTESYTNHNTPTPPSVGISFSADGHPVMVQQKNTNTTWNRGMASSCSAIFVASPKGTILETKIQGDSCYGSSGFASRLSNPEKNPLNVPSAPTTAQPRKYN